MSTKPNLYLECAKLIGAGIKRRKQKRQSELSATLGSAVGCEFYNGVEWLACWMLDNVEGEIITEELLRLWASKAWVAHLKRQNDEVSHRHD